MQKRSVGSTSEQDASIDEDALVRRGREEALKLEALRAQLTIGAESLDRGDFVELDEGELARFLARGGSLQDRRRR